MPSKPQLSYICHRCYLGIYNSGSVARRRLQRTNIIRHNIKYIHPLTPPFRLVSYSPILICTSLTAQHVYYNDVGRAAGQPREEGSGFVIAVDEQVWRERSGGQDILAQLQGLHRPAEVPHRRRRAILNRRAV